MSIDDRRNDFTARQDKRGTRKSIVTRTKTSMRTYRQRLRGERRRRAWSRLGGLLVWVALISIAFAGVSFFFVPMAPQNWTLVALLLSLGSLLYGVWSSASQGARMTRLEGLLSTASIGAFPEHIDEITRLAADIRHDFYCMVDCVDYASFSDPQGHDKLAAALKDALTKKATVRILVCGTPAAITRSSPLVGLSWSDLQKTPEFREYFSKYHRGTSAPVTEDAFRQLLLAREQIVADDLSDKGAQIKTTAATSCSQFLWVADDREAVFLWVVGEGAAMQAYRTRDTRLIEALKATFEANWPATE